MVSDRPLQDVDSAWPVFVVVNRAEDAARFDGHKPHAKLAANHAGDLQAKVNRRKQLNADTLCFRRDLFVAHSDLLRVLQRRPNLSLRMFGNTVGQLDAPMASSWPRQR